jgi:hypothetical protein
MIVLHQNSTGNLQVVRVCNVQDAAMLHFEAVLEDHANLFQPVRKQFSITLVAELHGNSLARLVPSHNRSGQKGVQIESSQSNLVAPGARFDKDCGNAWEGGTRSGSNQLANKLIHTRRGVRSRAHRTSFGSRCLFIHHAATRQTEWLQRCMTGHCGKTQVKKMRFLQRHELLILAAIVPLPEALAELVAVYAHTKDWLGHLHNFFGLHSIDVDLRNSGFPVRNVRLRITRGCVPWFRVSALLDDGSAVSRELTCDELWDYFNDSSSATHAIPEHLVLTLWKRTLTKRSGWSCEDEHLFDALDVLHGRAQDALFDGLRHWGFLPGDLSWSSAGRQHQTLYLRWLERQRRDCC